MTTTCGRISTIEAALTALEHAQDNLLGLGNDSLLQFATLREDDGVGALPHQGTPWGVKASQGSRPNMEDAYSVQVPQQSCSAGHCSQHPSADVTAPSGEHQDGGAALSAVAEQEEPSGQAMSVGIQEPIIAPPIPEDLAVLSVFDGHGGTEVAEHARTRLHMHFAASLSEQRSAAAGSGEAGESAGHWADPCQRCPHHGSLPTADRDCKACALQHVADALRAAFLKTDSELEGSEAGEYVGATAVVAVVGREHIWIAHCGDSRAVIQRNGESIALTRDHKPDREDEAARIKAAGGRIVFSNGSHRVMGMLAMSRALGDHFLRPYVIADPEVTCVERTMQDEVLVLATDGLWDVFSCKDATTLAQRCITRSKERGMSRHGACRVAASVLTKVALERGSRDNITVIVVDVSMSSSTNHHHHPQPHHPHPQPHHHSTQQNHHATAPNHHHQPQQQPAADAPAASTSGKPPLAPSASRAQTASGAAGDDSHSGTSAAAPSASAAATAATADSRAEPQDARPAASAPASSPGLPPLDPSAAFGTTFSKLQMHASAAAAGLTAPPAKSSSSPSSTLTQVPATATQPASTNGAANDKPGPTRSQQDGAAAAPAANTAPTQPPQPALARQSMGDVSMSSSDDGKAAAGGSAGSKGSAGGVGSRSQGFSVTTCTWVKGGSSTSLNTLANAPGSGTVPALSQTAPGPDRAVDRSTSIPSHSGDRPTYASTVSERATTKGTTFSPGETMSVDAGMAAASASGTQGKGAPVSPRGTIGATHRLAVAATHAAQPHGEAQSAVVRALKAEQQEAAAAAAAGAARSQLPPAHPSGSRSAGDAAPAPARNASENGAATAAARKPRVVAKRPDSNVPRKTSSQSNEGAAQVPGAASAPAAAAGEDAAGDSGKQRSSDQTRSVSVDEPTPTGYRTF